MNKLAITTAAALGAFAAFCAWAEWVYEGRWGTRGSGNGQFYGPLYVAASPNGTRAYVTDADNDRVQYFKKRD